MPERRTLLKTISGLIRPTDGRIIFKGQDITRRPAHKTVEMGISQVAEGRAILKRMTVIENLRMGAHTRRDKDVDPDMVQILEKFPVLSRAAKAAGWDTKRR